MLDVPLPIVAAPMAGGASTPALVAAVCDAGGFAFLPAGYKTADALADEMRQLRGVEFGVNLFVSSPSGISSADFRQYARELVPEAAAYGIDIADEPLREDDDGWSDKIEVLLADPVPFVSVTFGVPEPAAMSSLHRVGTRVLITVTTVDEALAARDAGADGLVAQGSDAGGHSGTHDPRRRITPMPTDQLVRDVVAAAGLPTVAAGGVDGPARVRELVAAGATAVAAGTLLLRSDESGASRLHKDALVDPARDGTVVTRAFTGRPARALRNGFIDRHGPTAPSGYPAIHHLTRRLRSAAMAAGDAERAHLWAGPGHRHARTGPAAAIITGLAAEL
jgi:NAD(P)H-dependent flavin oxidoreductase YrpB (nitropropane dioxygenase family)